MQSEDYQLEPPVKLYRISDEVLKEIFFALHYWSLCIPAQKHLVARAYQHLETPFLNYNGMQSESGIIANKSDKFFNLLKKTLQEITDVGTRAVLTTLIQTYEAEHVDK